MSKTVPEFLQLQIDALGGMAGDMFTAAVLDAFPEHEAGTLASVAAVTGSEPVQCRLLPHHDGVLQGRRFSVELPGTQNVGHHDHGPDQHGHHVRHDHGHHEHRHDPHQSWAGIRALIEQAQLDPAVRDGALAIFEHLARAEARVHGIEVAEVAFHEVGAWDSIADVVAAAHLAAVLSPATWTVGPLPLGSGRVSTAHGWLPIPAPATALLLQGFATMDDGVGGERVTPTGAAILRHLCGNSLPSHDVRRLHRTGIGFGTRTLPGIPNCVRLLAFIQVPVAQTPGIPMPVTQGHRDLGIIEFEVDDQSAEELAMGLDRLRNHPDIFDVVQMPVFGKKGRMMTHVRALVRADALDETIGACFRETTTIGLRHHRVSGAALDRRSDAVEVGGRTVRVKSVDRPGGRTAKAESDDVLGQDGHAARAALRREAEQAVLAGDAL
ncbi:MAG TPA: LarC family nickel insertion protein [Acetobacteraceae bacterium]